LIADAAGVRSQIRGDDSRVSETGEERLASRAAGVLMKERTRTSSLSIVRGLSQFFRDDWGDRFEWKNFNTHPSGIVGERGDRRVAES